MGNNLVYGPLDLPSGKKVKFRAPFGSDRNNILQMTQISADRAVSDALLIDDYVAAKCITEVDGKPSDGDYKRTFDNWQQKDILFYRSVFDQMFGISDEDSNRAKDAAAFLLKGQTSTAGCSSPNTAM
jgi:hypothetical protein